MRLSALIIAMGLTLFCTAAAHADNAPRIPVKLFGDDVTEDYEGCHFALWQHNRHPDKDRYSYIFYAPIHNAVALPGWMKTGDTVHELQRLDQEGDDGALDAHQLYRNAEGTLNVIMDINRQSREGDWLVIEDAYLTIIMDDRFPFGSKVKGRMGCSSKTGTLANAASVKKGTLPGDPVTLSGPETVESFDLVPAPIIRHIRENLQENCDLDRVVEYANRYSVSDAMSLWEIPCALYARNTSSIFFTVLNEQPEYFVSLFHQVEPGSQQADALEVINASVAPETGSVFSYNFFGATNSCGVYEEHRLRAVEGEAIELHLAEFRQKEACDETPLNPEEFPLVYLAE